MSPIFYNLREGCMQFVAYREGREANRGVWELSVLYPHDPVHRMFATEFARFDCRLPGVGLDCSLQSGLKCICC